MQHVYRWIDALCWHYEDRWPSIANTIYNWLDRRRPPWTGPLSQQAARYIRALDYLYTCAAQQPDPDAAMLLIEQHLFGDE